MNKNLYLIAVFAGTLTLACSAPVAANNHDCAKIKDMKLSVGEYHLDLDEKKVVCVPVPSDFSIRVKGKGGYDVKKGQVTVAKKTNSGGPNVSISGNNSINEKWLVVKVRGTASVGTPVSFLIDVDDVGVLDPKIRIIDTAIFLRFQEEEMHEMATAMGATIKTLEFGDPTWTGDEKE